MKNIHIIMNDLTGANRILKQIRSLADAQVFTKYYIIALSNKSSLVKEDIDSNITVIRIELKTKKLPKSLIFQIIKYVELSLKAIFILYKIKPNVVNAHSISVLPIASLAKAIINCKLIYDPHELETERNGLNGFKKQVSKIIEKYLIKYVDLTFVVSESISDWYSQEYKIIKPLVIMNSPKYRECKKENLFRQQLNISEDQKILLYQGALSKGRGIEQLIAAFSKRINQQLVIIFMGYGELEELIINAANSHNNIFFYPAVSTDIVLEYTSSADIGINLGQNVCLSYDYSMPNKLFEYAMSGLPIVVSNLKEMSECIINNNMGTVIYYNSPENINKSLDDFLMLDHSLFKTNAHKFANKNSWEIQETKMIKAYNSLLKNREIRDV